MLSFLPLVNDSGILWLSGMGIGRRHTFQSNNHRRERKEIQFHLPILPRQSQSLSRKFWTPPRLSPAVSLWLPFHFYGYFSANPNSPSICTHILPHFLRYPSITLLHVPNLSRFHSAIVFTLFLTSASNLTFFPPSPSRLPFFSTFSTSHNFL